MQFSQIKETCLYVSDLEEAQQFYGEVLGLPLIHASEGRHVFFRAGSSVLLIFHPAATQAEETLPPHYAAGKQHLAFECRPGEYQAWKDRLQAAGVAITHEQSWGGGRESFYFEDPAGHVLEVVQPGIWGD